MPQKYEGQVPRTQSKASTATLNSIRCSYTHALKQSVNYNYIFIKLNPICATDHWHIYFFHNTMVNRNVHSVELQIYADSICNVVLDDITL